MAQPHYKDTLQESAIAVHHGTRSVPGHAQVGDDGDDEDRSGSQGRGGKGEALRRSGRRTFPGRGSGGWIPGWGRFICSCPRSGRAAMCRSSSRRGRRSEQALIAVVQEAFINGVSTRKIERLAQAMGIENISASQVSEFNKELDAQVDRFQEPAAGRGVSLPLDRRPVPEGPGRRSGRLGGRDDRLRRQSGRITGDPGRGAHVRRIGGLLAGLFPQAQEPGA